MKINVLENGVSIIRDMTPEEEAATAENIIEPIADTTEQQKTDALTAIQKATTIASLKTVMLNYIDIAGLN